MGIVRSSHRVRFSHPLLLEESEMLYLQAFLAFLFWLKKQRVSKRVSN